MLRSAVGLEVIIGATEDVTARIAARELRGNLTEGSLSFGLTRKIKT